MLATNVYFKLVLTINTSHDMVLVITYARNLDPLGSVAAIQCIVDLGVPIGMCMVYLDGRRPTCAPK